MPTDSMALAATSLAPTPLAAALSQSGISLPIPYLDLSPQVIRDLPLESVAALQRFTTWDTHILLTDPPTFVDGHVKMTHLGHRN
ncbi:hypothetical protein [Hydrogenophilus thiooxidans]|uniref:hypothetical protein n=1 Tax=Hydrogenophilus thiooxidans TaxID=2820326 RepID=UPI001C24B0B0|nr:hypothetical protein [Hydrogenophilus thiooxidans]